MFLLTSFLPFVCFLCDIVCLLLVVVFCVSVCSSSFFFTLNYLTHNTQDIFDVGDAEPEDLIEARKKRKVQQKVRKQARLFCARSIQTFWLFR
jgi:hypothetical protein